jgi:hypothetical protein
MFYTPMHHVPSELKPQNLARDHSQVWTGAERRDVTRRAPRIRRRRESLFVGSRARPPELGCALSAALRRLRLRLLPPSLCWVGARGGSALTPP